MSTVTRILHRKKVFVKAPGSGSCFSWPNETFYEQYPFTVGGNIILEHENSDWRRDIALGRSATTAFIANEIELIHTDCYIDSDRWCNAATAKNWSSEVVTGAMHAAGVTVPSAASTGLDPEVDGRALREYVKRARAAQGAFRGSTFAVELAQALRMIRNPAKGLRDLVDRQHAITRNRLKRVIGRDPLGVRARDLNRATRRNAQRALSDSWLEHQFGWLPLVSDIEDGYKSLRRFANRKPLTRVGSEANAKEQTGWVKDSSSINNLNIFTEVFDFREQQVKYYGAVKAETTAAHSSAIEEFGFRTRDFVPALWEWIPYSFLVDYFTNIGDMVEGASFPRSDLAWTSKTFRNTNVRDGSRTTYTKKTSFVWPASNTIRVNAFIPSIKIWRRKYVNRSNYYGSLVPNFRWEIPGGRNWRRWLNMVALANMRFMSR